MVYRIDYKSTKHRIRKRKAFGIAKRKILVAFSGRRDALTRQPAACERLSSHQLVETTCKILRAHLGEHTATRVSQSWTPAASAHEHTSFSPGEPAR